MKRSSKRQDLTLIDLFAGCGGLGLGLESAGFAPLAMNELSDHARETYLVNREQRFPLLRKYSTKDIFELTGDRDNICSLVSGLRKDHSLGRGKTIDLVVGGPPCQGFSSIGIRRSYAVARRRVPSNHLYKEMAKVISIVQPKAFLFENVEGLLAARWTPDGVAGEIFKDVLQTFQNIDGYSVKFSLVRSGNYGVPQRRPRILMVGIRRDVYEGTSTDIDAVNGGFLPRGKAVYPDLADVLSDLVDPDFQYGGRTERYPKRAQSAFQERIRGGKPAGAMVHDHEYSRHSQTVISKFAYMIKSEGRIHHQHRTKKFNQRLLPKRWDEDGPNITITSLPDDFVHFEQPRSLTVRECARIQTFPDWYRFVGPRTVGGTRRAGNPLEDDFSRTVPRYTQIGNAVPVDLAKAVGRHLAEIIRG